MLTKGPTLQNTTTVSAPPADAPYNEADDGNAIAALILVTPLLVGFWGGLATLIAAVTGAGTTAMTLGASTIGAGLGAAFMTRHHRARLRRGRTR